MADLATAVATNAAGTLVAEYGSPYLSYFFHYGKIAHDFKEKRKALQLKKERVKNDVDDAIRQTEVIEKDVKDWLTRAEEELQETQKLVDEIDHVKCCKWCPNWGWQYSLSKKLAKKTLIISKLLETCDFPLVGRRPPLKGTDFITSEGFIDSESSKSAFNEIMEAINANGVNLIGVHGMPGVGKTTLAIEVLKHVEEQKMFNKVVMFTMSKTPNINKIQDKIADMLGFRFESNGEEGKAAELRRSIRGQKKILVIVDDLWEEYKLKTIGIPFGDEHKSCKVLLTTRNQEVCAKMGCQKEIQLHILSENEAWALFKDNAGLDDGSSTLIAVAKEIAGECKGLPLAIVTVAKALNKKRLDVWKAANQRLKDSRHLDNEEVFGEVYEHLQLSYDFLKKHNSEAMGNDIQSCFLLCSLFPEDYEILIETLVMCGIGVGLFSNVSSIQGKRTEIGVAIRKLVKCGLLLETDEEEEVKMHDVVRDFAHWLKSKEEDKFMVKDGLEEWPNMVESLGCYAAIALWNCSSLNNFPDKVEFSKLKILVLNGNKGRLRVPTLVFQEMKALRLLYLNCVDISMEGLPSLSSLRTLICMKCKLENLSSSLGNMRHLEVLALCGCKVREILEELMELSTLKYLHLCAGDSDQQIHFPPTFLSRLKSLQELQVTSENNLNLLKLKSLPCLTALSLRISTNQWLEEKFVFPELQRYDIVVNDSWERLTGRRLKIKDVSCSLSAFKDLFRNVEKLSLENVCGQNNIVPTLCKNRVNELTSLELDSCEDMEFLIDRTGEEQGPTVAFTNLVELDIRKMACLKQLCNGPSPISFFQKLERVKIKDCSDLRVVFQLDKFFEKVETQTPLLSTLTVLKLGSLPVLESIWKLDSSLRAIASLQSLKRVTIQDCSKLKTIFSPCLSQSLVHLQQLHIENCQGLEQVIGITKKEETTENHYPLCWPKMKTIRIVGCERLKYLFPVTSSQTFPMLDLIKLRECPELIRVFGSTEEDVIGNEILLNAPNLRELSVEDCPKFTCFIAQAQLIEELSLVNAGTSCQMCNIDVPTLNQDYIMVGNHEHVFQVQGRGSSFSNIKRLELRDLSESRIIWKDPAQVITLDNLTSLKLYDSKKLRYIFSPTMVSCLSRLCDLEISGCEELEGIILAKDDEVVVPASPNADATLQPVISFPNLAEITIRDCKVLKSLFPFGSAPLLPKLETLTIIGNSKLEQVFDLEVIAEKKIKFDQLRILMLDGLPCLIEFCPKGYHFVFPSLNYLEVKECPKMTTNFFIDSVHHVHSITVQETEVCPTTTTQNIVHDMIIEELTPLLMENNYMFWTTWTALRGLQSY